MEVLRWLSMMPWAAAEDLVLQPQMVVWGAGRS